MKRSALIAALTLALTIPASASATDVTALPVIQRDLALAATFWKVQQPTLVAPCATGQVFVTQMQDATGDHGAIVRAADVWAETQLGSCTINIAPLAWALGSSGDSNTSLMLCVLVAHEFGHTLGLADSEAIPMMSSEWRRRDNPLCNQAVFGWRWTLHKDRRWLAANQLARGVNGL